MYQPYLDELKEKGYTIIRGVINKDEVNATKKKVYSWQKTIPNHDWIHSQIDPHGIYKYHNVGHTDFAWYLRTHPKILEIFKFIWNTEELIVSYDGSCWIPEKCNKTDKI